MALYPNNARSTATCSLNAGFVESQNSGGTWATPVSLPGASSASSAMSLSWLAQGPTVGGTTGTAYSGGVPFPALSLASAPSGRRPNQGIYTIKGLQ